MFRIDTGNCLGRHYLVLVLVSILISSFGISHDISAFGATYTITKVQSGLVADDPLNNETKTKQQVLADQSYWTYYGTAVAEKHTTYNIYKDSQGLHIGEPGPNPATFGDGSYSGFYAESPDTNSLLVHVVLTATNQSVPHNDFQNQLEIMTTSGQVNYLDCAAITNSDGTYWTVVHGYGDAVEAYHWDTLWLDNSPNQPLTRDCTVLTNGQNYLKVYIDNVLVYSSNTLALKMPRPFNYYLQTMNSYFGGTRYGIFQDYYATSDENIKVTNNPSNAAAVKIVDNSGNVLASGPVVVGGTTLNIGKYHFPLAATINVYDSNNSVIASSPANMYGGDVFSVTAGGASTALPPTGLAATTVSSSQINLSWTAPTDNGGSPLTGYKIERSVSGGAFAVIVANTGSTATTFSNTGLQSSTTYTYRVSAINGIGTSSPSNTASATTSASATAPSPPASLTANAVSSSKINLSWNAPSNNGGSPITGYRIGRSTDGGATWAPIVSNTGSTATTYSDTGLAQNTTYTYRVFAINSVGTSSPSNTASATTSALTTAPSPPTGLAATTVSSSQINLSWTAPTDNGGSPLTGYKIERSVSGGAFAVIVANTGSTATTFSNTGLQSSTTYTYRVSAINGIGTSSPSNTASATTSASATAPSQPTNVTATAVSHSQINLSWTAPTDNGGSPITGYKIDRSTDGGSTWSTIVSNTGSTSTTYSDTMLLSNTTYTYRVSAINQVGTSTPSNTASATTPLVEPIPIPPILIH